MKIKGILEQFLGFPHSLVGKESACSAGDLGLIPGSAQSGIRIAGRNINNLRYADDTTLMAESEEELRAS